MQIDETETDLLKKWVIKKLEDTSDADSDVLADFVLALIGTEDSRPVAKTSLIENLKDFLNDNTESFVEDLLLAISTKSYDPSKPPPKPSAAVYSPPKRQSFRQSQPPDQSKKRSYHDWDREENTNGQPHSFHDGERPAKQLRRGRRGWDQRGGRQPFSPMNQYGGPSQEMMPKMPTPPPGMPPLDPNNPLATIMAMQQALGLFPGNQNGQSYSNGNYYKPPPNDRPCPDYADKGFCAAGASCPYEHGDKPLVIPAPNQEYDPTNSSLLDVTPTRVGQFNTTVGSNGRGGGRGRGRGRGRGSGNLRGRGGQSEFHHAGPSRDASNTSIVAAQIPEDKCDEKSVRSFFEEFGNIQEVTIHPEKRLAIIEYDSHEAAQLAYESPKVVFENRFVKVYWRKPAADLETSGAMINSREEKLGRKEDQVMQDDEQIDLVELNRRQEEAQRKHEEAKRQRGEAEKQRQDLGAKLKAMELERKKMSDVIAKKSGKPTSPADEGSEESDQTRALKEQLTKLEEEAKSLGIDPESAMSGHSSHGSYRGQGDYSGRGRGRVSHRGSRGRWLGTATRGGAVMRLDNRPKTVVVTFLEGNYDAHDEALRQFLLFNNIDSASVAKHPGRDDVALITFNQRYEGENFMAAANNSELLHIGKVELSWHKPDDTAVVANGNHEQDVKMVAEVTEDEPSSDVKTIDGYEVADDEDLDRWS